MKVLRTAIRHNDSVRSVITNPGDSILQTTPEFGDMALNMAGKKVSM